MIWFSRSRKIPEAELHTYFNRDHYRDHHPPVYFTRDSGNESSQYNPGSLARDIILREGTLGGDGDNNAKFLPWTAQQLRGSLPSWLKLYVTTNSGGEPVFMVNPSSGILKGTVFYFAYSEGVPYEGSGKSLFRGESRQTPDEDARAISQQIRIGELRSPFADSARNIFYHPVCTSAELKTSLPYMAYHLSLNDNGGRGRPDSGHLWVIDTAAMDRYLVSVHFGGAEITFPRISTKFVRACITTPHIKEQVEKTLELPPGFLIPSETMAYADKPLQVHEELKYLVGKLEEPYSELHQVG